jgi:dihydroneopterin aldolase
MKIGVADWERAPDCRQTVLVDIDMWAASGTFKDASLDDCMDYARIYEYLTREWPSRPHTDLLETLAEELVGFCFADEKVRACRVTLRKPDVFKGRAVPAVTFYRTRV